MAFPAATEMHGVFIWRGKKVSCFNFVDSHNNETIFFLEIWFHTLRSQIIFY